MATKTMREQLAEAFDKNAEIEDEEAGGPPEDTEEPVGSPEEEAEEEVEDDAPEEDAPAEEDPEPEGKGGDKGEDKGRTADPTKDKPDKSGGKPGVPKDGSGKEKVDEDSKPPVSWKPAIREHWAKLPKEVREEVLRREKEIEKGLHQASGSRKVAAEYFNVVKPFEQLIRAQNSTPAQAITSLMTTAARLTMGTKAQKAQVLSEIIKNYDVDIEALDTVLAGKTVPAEEDKISRLLEDKLKPFQELLSTVHTSRRNAEESTSAEINQELETFANDPKNEFFNDVVDDIADIMDLASKRGTKLSLQEGYDRACQMNPDVAKVLSQRAAAAAGQVDRERLRKKQNAASSIKGNRTEDDGVPDPTDLRATLARSWREAESDR